MTREESWINLNLLAILWHGACGVSVYRDVKDRRIVEIKKKIAIASNSPFCDS